MLAGHNSRRHRPDHTHSLVPDALTRCRSVIDLLEMKDLAGRSRWVTD